MVRLIPNQILGIGSYRITEILNQSLASYGITLIPILFKSESG